MIKCFILSLLLLALTTMPMNTARSNKLKVRKESHYIWQSGERSPDRWSELPFLGHTNSPGGLKPHLDCSLQKSWLWNNCEQHFLSSVLCHGAMFIANYVSFNEIQYCSFLEYPAHLREKLLWLLLQWKVQSRRVQHLDFTWVKAHLVRHSVETFANANATCGRGEISSTDM